MRGRKMDFNINFPCQKCNKRQVGCHGSCAEYLNTKIQAKNLKQKRKKEINIWSDVMITRRHIIKDF